MVLLTFISGGEGGGQDFRNIIYYFISPHRREPLCTEPRSSQTIGLNVAAAEFSPVMAPQQTTRFSHSTPGQSSLQLQQFDAWMTIVQAIKQSLLLPKVEWMKFSGYPLECEVQGQHRESSV